MHERDSRAVEPHLIIFPLLLFSLALSRLAQGCDLPHGSRALRLARSNHFRVEGGSGMEGGPFVEALKERTNEEGVRKTCTWGPR